jgi:nucleoside-diphosphate-sugar epimerase
MPRPDSDDVHLITGFPSFTPRKLLEHILTVEPRAYVYVVVMPKLQPAADAALGALPAEQRTRVHVLEGDAAAMDLGLSGQEFRQLATELDYIHHLAHASYVGVDRETAQALNMVGVVEILELAKATVGLKCLVLHSTAKISGRRTGVVYEEELDVGQSFHNFIEETRMRGEKIARAAMGTVPIAVVRPTIIVGDSGSGETGRFGGPYVLISLIMSAPQEIALPLPGGGDAPLNIVPIDFVVTAAHAISKRPDAIGRTFHLADPRPLPARQVFEMVARAAGRRVPSGSFPASLTKALMRAPGIERFLRSPRELVEQLTTSVRYDCRNADRLLAGTDIHCPPFESYVDQLVAHVESHLDRQRHRRGAGDDEGDAPPTSRPPEPG